MGNILRFFSDIKLVQGYNRICIYDLSRNDYSFIEKCHFGLNLINSYPLINITNNTILNLLFEKEFIFSCSKKFKNSFPEIEYIHHSPNFVQIVEIYVTHVNKNIEYYKFSVSLLAKHYIINWQVDIIYLEDFLQKNFDNSPTVGLYLIFNNTMSNEGEVLLEKIASKRKYIIEMYLNSSSSELLNKSLLKEIDIFFPKFSININLFSESQKHHTYFNKKLYIGPNGEIKNAPECPESFGYIQDINEAEELKSIIATPEFQKYWLVHKEITDVCKDCEFRHMCVDNRLPYQRAENEWYHKTECNYNPYICKWQGEEGYLTLQECGIRSDETGFYIDHDKIAAINRELWGDDE